jgi:hypothetical protein
MIKGEEGWKVLDGRRITAEVMIVGFQVKPIAIENMQVDGDNNQEKGREE